MRFHQLRALAQIPTIQLVKADVAQQRFDIRGVTCSPQLVSATPRVLPEWLHATWDLVRWVCVLPRALAIVLGWIVVHDDSGDGADLL